VLLLKEGSILPITDLNAFVTSTLISAADAEPATRQQTTDRLRAFAKRFIAVSPKLVSKYSSLQRLNQ